MYIISRTMELGSPQNQNKDGLLGSNSIVVVYYIHIYIYIMYMHALGLKTIMLMPNYAHVGVPT